MDESVPKLGREPRPDQIDGFGTAKDLVWEQRDVSKVVHDIPGNPYAGSEDED